jgi:hypothetical protein
VSLTVALQRALKARRMGGARTTKMYRFPTSLTLKAHQSRVPVYPLPLPQSTAPRQASGQVYPVMHHLKAISREHSLKLRGKYNRFALPRRMGCLRRLNQSAPAPSDRQEISKTNNNQQSRRVRGRLSNHSTILYQQAESLNFRITLSNGITGTG